MDDNPFSSPLQTITATKGIRTRVGSAQHQSTGHQASTWFCIFCCILSPVSSSQITPIMFQAEARDKMEVRIYFSMSYGEVDLGWLRLEHEYAILLRRDFCNNKELILACRTVSFYSNIICKHDALFHQLIRMLLSPNFPWLETAKKIQSVKQAPATKWKYAYFGMSYVEVDLGW
jgi:hypothetical protein